MDKKQKVAIGILAGLTAVGIGTVIYDEVEKSKCEKANGSWHGLFGGCMLPAPSSTSTSTTPTSTTPTSTSSAPGQVDPSTVDIIWKTAEATSQSIPGVLSWDAVSGATSYQVSINGGSPVTVYGTSTQIQAQPGSTIQISIVACS